MAAHTWTDANGWFEFNDLPALSYDFWVDVPSVTNLQAPSVTVSTAFPVWDSLQLCLTTTHLVITNNTTGVQEMDEDQKISIYPNPAGSLVTVDWTNTNTSVLLVRILDQMGREVAHQPGSNLSSCQFDLSRLPHGHYVVQLISEQGLINRPLVH